MNPPAAPSPGEQDKARQIREERVRQQQFNILRQRENIERQRKSSGAASAGPSKPKPSPAVVQEKAPPPPAVVPQEPKVEPPRPAELAEMRAEMREFTTPRFGDKPARAAEPARPVAAAKPPVPPSEDAAIEIEYELPATEMPALKLATPTDEPLMVEPPEIVADVPPAAVTPPKGRTQPLKMVKSLELSCPKCGSVIPESQRGAYYTECRRCGEIIKMDSV